MSKGVGSGIGRDVLVARGFAEWLFNFGIKLPLEITSWGYRPPESKKREFTDEVIVLLANLLQGGDM